MIEDPGGERESAEASSTRTKTMRSAWSPRGVDRNGVGRVRVVVVSPRSVFVPPLLQNDIETKTARLARTAAPRSAVAAN
eukprot:2181326-Pyramimonas_sp.AAC.1